MHTEHTDLVLEKDTKKMDTILKFLEARTYMDTDTIRLRVAGLAVVSDTLRDHAWHPSLVANAIQLLDFADDEWDKLSELLAFEDE